MIFAKSVLDTRKGRPFTLYGSSAPPEDKTFQKVKSYLFLSSMWSRTSLFGVDKTRVHYMKLWFKVGIFITSCSDWMHFLSICREIFPVRQRTKAHSHHHIQQVESLDIKYIHNMSREGLASVIPIARSLALWLKHGWEDSPQLTINLWLSSPWEPTGASLCLVIFMSPIVRVLIKRCLI